MYIYTGSLFQKNKAFLKFIKLDFTQPMLTALLTLIKL